MNCPRLCVWGLGHGFKLRLELGLGQVLGWGYLGWLGLWAGERIRSYENPQKYSSTGMCVPVYVCPMQNLIGANNHDDKLGPFPSKISKNSYWQECIVYVPFCDCVPPNSSSTSQEFQETMHYFGKSLGLEGIFFLSQVFWLKIQQSLENPWEKMGYYHQGEM